MARRRLETSTPDASSQAEETPERGWGPAERTPTTLVLVRHGVTDHTKGKLFSGGLASANPPLNDEGREQARATGEWLAPLAGTFDALVSSPVRRTRETAEILAAFFDLEIEEEPGIAEMEFGTWDGMSFTEVHEKFPDEMSAWLGDLESAPHGGESFRAVEKRVLEGRDRIVASYAGQTVVAVSHVTPIKTLVADALGAPLEAVYRMELAPASVTVISYFQGGPDGDLPMANLRLYNGRPTGSSASRLPDVLRNIGASDAPWYIRYLQGIPNTQDNQIICTFQTRSTDSPISSARRHGSETEPQPIDGDAAHSPRRRGSVQIYPLVSSKLMSSRPSAPCGSMITYWTSRETLAALSD